MGFKSCLSVSQWRTAARQSDTTDNHVQIHVQRPNCKLWPVDCNFRTSRAPPSGAGPNLRGSCIGADVVAPTFAHFAFVLPGLGYALPWCACT